MKRRDFLQRGSLAGIAATIPVAGIFASSNEENSQQPASTPTQDREYWVQLLCKMSEPVLSNMSKGMLRKNMVVEYSPTWDGRDKGVAFMECFGRLIAGIAPWLALPDDNTAEGKKCKQLREWALKSYAHAVDPASPDYLTWDKEGQPLVDAAYIAQSFLRAPKALWEPLDATTKQRYIKEFKDLRRVRPAYNNWLLFAAMTEVFLLSIGEQCDYFRIDMAIRKINEWYEGDGWYADGPVFSFDYYNGYVIHSMLVDTLDIMVQKGRTQKKLYEDALKRMQRYSEFLERMISPEGFFPAFGRSATYRMGGFQPLSQLALMEKLPEGVTPAQVRCALTAAMKRMFAVEGNFNKDGYLTLGFAGHQPNLADYYSNSGSMYITSLVFLALGLPTDKDFWAAPAEEWTACKAWSGKPFKKDYHVTY